MKYRDPELPVHDEHNGGISASGKDKNEDSPPVNQEEEESPAPGREEGEENAVPMEEQVEESQDSAGEQIEEIPDTEGEQKEDITDSGSEKQEESPEPVQEEEEVEAGKDTSAEIEPEAGETVEEQTLDEPAPADEASAEEDAGKEQAGEVKEEIVENREEEDPAGKEEPEEEKAKEEDREPEVQDMEMDADRYAGITVEPVDYSHHTKDELIEVLKILLDTKPVGDIMDDVESIKLNFYKKHRAEQDQLRKKFLEDGNPVEDFSPVPDPREDELKNLYKKYRSLRSEFNRQMEVQKEENLKKKYEVIGEIESLVNREESINKTFQEFRELQTRWRDIGPVPQQHVKDMWENYHYQVEKFYDFIKINKELRDLDLKKNMEVKTELCEKAEELLLEENVVRAFRNLQELHDRWREIGPVPHENKEEIWERFRNATTQINKRHQEHFVEIKEAQKRNLEAKEELCNKVDLVLEQGLKSPRDWENASRQIVELQKVWKTIGFAPKKHNARIYRRFREACDGFFKAKREFYSEHKEVQKNNLQLKIDLCVQAEALQNSTDWKKTTEILIELQKRWKEIGPVPRKQADQVWKRFRTACDAFFQSKSQHFTNKEEDFVRNLEAKQKLLVEIEKYQPGEDSRLTIEQVKEFQKRWSEIGFVPAGKKDEVQQRYRTAINKLFDRLKMDDGKKNLLKYRSRLENMKGSERADYKMQQDRDKFINKIKQLESDIVLWENNIGFFAKSKNAEAMIRDVQNRIDQARQEIKTLEEKVRLIDSYEPED